MRQAFDRLRGLSLIEGWSAPPTEGSVVSRRRAVFDLARAAAVACAVPAAFGGGDALTREQQRKR